MLTICSSVLIVLALFTTLSIPGAGTSPSMHGAWASTRLGQNFGEAILECGEWDASPVLRLRGGLHSGPKAKLTANKHDIRVHWPSNKLVKPHHLCIKSALHRKRIEVCWMRRPCCGLWGEGILFWRSGFPVWSLGCGVCVPEESSLITRPA
jgi:hypothetical protein